MVLPLDTVDVSLRLSFIQHRNETASLIDEATSAEYARLVRHEDELRRGSAVDSDFIIAKGADQELFTVIHLEVKKLSEPLSFWSDLSDLRLGGHTIATVSLV